MQNSKSSVEIMIDKYHTTKTTLLIYDAVNSFTVKMYWAKKKYDW